LKCNFEGFDKNNKLLRGVEKHNTTFAKQKYWTL